MEFKKAIPREVVIQPTHNGGFIVHTGCCQLAFSEPEDLLTALRQYLIDPEKAEKSYNELIRRAETPQDNFEQVTPAPATEVGRR